MIPDRPDGDTITIPRAQLHELRQHGVPFTAHRYTDNGGSVILTLAEDAEVMTYEHGDGRHRLHFPDPEDDDKYEGLDEPSIQERAEQIEQALHGDEDEGVDEREWTPLYWDDDDDFVESVTPGRGGPNTAERLMQIRRQLEADAKYADDEPAWTPMVEPRSDPRPVLEAESERHEAIEARVDDIKRSFQEELDAPPTLMTAFPRGTDEEDIAETLVDLSRLPGDTAIPLPSDGSLPQINESVLPEGIDSDEVAENLLKILNDELPAVDEIAEVMVERMKNETPDAPLPAPSMPEPIHGPHCSCNSDESREGVTDAPAPDRSVGDYVDVEDAYTIPDEDPTSKVDMDDLFGQPSDEGEAPTFKCSKCPNKQQIDKPGISDSAWVYCSECETERMFVRV